MEVRQTNRRADNAQRAAQFRAAIRHLSERERATLHRIHVVADLIDLRDSAQGATTPPRDRPLPWL